MYKIIDKLESMTPDDYLWGGGRWKAMRPKRGNNNILPQQRYSPWLTGHLDRSNRLLGKSDTSIRSSSNVW